MTYKNIAFRPIRRLLIANRGEIAQRVVKSARKMGITTIGLITNREPMSVADEPVLLEGSSLAETFLNARAIIAIALQHRADAIHPGYGFLSENAEFARQVEAAGLIFVVPSPDAIEKMGNKMAARRIAMDNKVPVIQSLEGTISEISKQAGQLHYPLLIKASAGGGGKGMVKVEHPDMLAEKLSQTSREAKSYFGDGTVYVEQYLENPRHIEVQIFGDMNGNIVHLFERECSIQRRFQKIIEEAPSPSLSTGKRQELTADALLLAKSIGYYNAGTVEFLLDRKGKHYFLEMNTRLQVEHAVTESITGIDLVELQLIVAMGLSLPLKQDDIKINGHSIESRIYAEDPTRDFMPSPGSVEKVKWPDQALARTDKWFDKATVIEPDFDPMLAKIITHSPSRPAATAKQINALEQTVITGLSNNIDYLKSIFLSEGFMSGNTTTAFCSEHYYKPSQIINPELAALAALALQILYRNDGDSVWHQTGFWRIDQQLNIEVNGDLYHLAWQKGTSSLPVVVNGSNRYKMENLKLSYSNLNFSISGESFQFAWAYNKNNILILENPSGRWLINEMLTKQKLKKQGRTNLRNDSQLLAPIPGKIIEVRVQPGDRISAGDALVILEAMKMENRLSAAEDGVVKSVRAREGQQVKANDILIDIEITHLEQ